MVNRNMFVAVKEDFNQSLHHLKQLKTHKFNQVNFQSFKPITLYNNMKL